MSQYPYRSARAALLATVLTAAGSWAAHAAPPANTVYIMVNNPAGPNAVLGYHRNIDGSLTKLSGSPFLTGGNGFAAPVTTPAFGPGPFDGEDIMAADPFGSVLYVPNGGSDNVSALRMAPDGSLSPVQGSPFATGGNTPEALGLRGNTLIIVNNGTDLNQGNGTGTPSYTTARIDLFGHVTEIPSATVSLPVGAVPTQATPAGILPLVFTNEKNAGTHSEYFLDLLGHLHLLLTSPGPTLAGNTTPTGTLGIDFSPDGQYEYVALTGASAIGVYRLGQSQGKLTETFLGSAIATSSTGDGAAPCWLHVSPDGKYAYTGNTASHSMSVFSLKNPAAPVLVQTQVVNGVGGAPTGATFDFTFSPDGQYVYFIETSAAIGNFVHILSVSQATGMVTEISASPVNLGELGTPVQGVIVF